VLHPSGLAHCISGPAPRLYLYEGPIFTEQLPGSGSGPCTTKGVQLCLRQGRF